MQATIFSRIEQRSVGKEVVDLLREAIISGKLPLGSHLGEIELSNQMAVSRIPIREALRQLEQEGLVQRHPNRGCFVIDFTEQDVLEVFSLRAMLESMAFQWAIPNLTAADLERLRQIIEQQEAAIQRKDYDDLARLDMKFHEYTCTKANHTRLLKAWYEQHAQCQILLNLRFYEMADYTPETVLEDHTTILNALQSADVDTAMQLTQEISNRVTSECIEILRQYKKE